MRGLRPDQLPTAMGTLAIGIALGLAPALLRPQTAQNPNASQFLSRQLQAERDFKEPVFFAPDANPRWPLTSETAAYKSISGDRMLGYVKELAEISQHSRDRGDQLWGRITGTQADAETAQWVMQKLKQMGVTDVHQEALDLPPQQVPKSWEAVVSGGGKTIMLESAVAARGAPGTPAGSTLDLEAVYAGLGTEADFAGRDVKGKAVFIYAEALPGAWKTSGTSYGAGRRAEERGAAAVFLTIGIPGNFRTVVGAGTSRVPGFTLGFRDGAAVREMIEQSAAGSPPRVKVRSDIQAVSGEKTSLVWGVIPGVTDEKIIINAHRDGYYDAADDNATGVATSLALAEYFAKLPKAKRRRTVVIVSNPGHHNTAVGNQWLIAHKDTFFAKAALLINSEHTGQVGADFYGYRLLPTNTPWNFDWFAGGGPKLAPIVTRDWDLFGISRYREPTASGSGDLGALDHLAPSIDLIQATPFYHSDHDTPESISPA
ncbi:MAG TPA: M28 family peptidase, partial [Bryobacteraceae bacterium]|nr:M28 family peptidase [Bryobacteraceae bacterium]